MEHKRREVNLLFIFFAVIAVLAGVWMAQRVTNSKSAVKNADYLKLGDKYLSKLQYDDAILAYKNALKIDNTNKKAVIGLGKSYVGTKNNEEIFSLESYVSKNFSEDEKEDVRDELNSGMTEMAENMCEKEDSDDAVAELLIIYIIADNPEKAEECMNLIFENSEMDTIENIIEFITKEGENTESEKVINLEKLIRGKQMECVEKEKAAREAENAEAHALFEENLWRFSGDATDEIRSSPWNYVTLDEGMSYFFFDLDLDGIDECISQGSYIQFSTWVCVWKKDGNSVSQIPISDDNLYEEEFQELRTNHVLTDHGNTVCIVQDAYFRLSYHDAEHCLYGFYGRMGGYGLKKFSLQEDGLHMKRLECVTDEEGPDGPRAEFVDKYDLSPVEIYE